MITNSGNREGNVKVIRIEDYEILDHDWKADKLLSGERGMKHG